MAELGTGAGITSARATLFVDSVDNHFYGQAIANQSKTPGISTRVSAYRATPLNDSAPRFVAS